MAERRYDPAEIEAKWQARWSADGAFNVEPGEGSRKYYLLEMLPYPSGRLHMGHVRNYAIGDVAARYKMMQGCNVLHPIGWDAFGMPAENAAIKHGVHPAKWTYENIDYMRGQFKRLGCSYDWDREFATCAPEYYRWEQLIFTKMFERGWAYKRTSKVNWCPACRTVLANEQAEGGVCWRCDSQVELRSMTQWYLRITDYAEELLRDVDEKLAGWPERVRVMQREWIGKSEGANIEFEMEGSKGRIAIFTTRPDTLFGATFMSLAWEHPLALELADACGRGGQVRSFIERSARIDHQARLAGSYEKEGEFTGAHCINPLTGRRMPIYVANFVLMDYGTGAVMAVPAHDQRDFEFARKYNLPIKVVIQPDGAPLDPRTMEGAWEGPGTLVESGHFSGMPSAEGARAITAHLAGKGMGGPTVTYRLKDWCISRQRYWGAPIPIVHCEACGDVAVPEGELPVELPMDVELTGEGGSPLAKVESFVNTLCPKCGKAARRETDTMDTFVESSWYMFRYTCPHHAGAPLDPEMVRYWMPVDQYIGGIEHAVGHLIYCRYFTKVMRDLGLVDLDEPVANLMTQGMVYKDGAKMSKSKGNVVDPDEMIKRYGADAVRLFMLFASPPEKDLEWSDQGIEGASRFVMRLWRLVDGWIESGANGAPGDDAERQRHRTIRKVTEDIERYHFNTAIAALMEYVNFLYGRRIESIGRESIETLVLLISPLMPHVAEEMWSMLGHGGCVLRERWPSHDESKIASDSVTVIVQVSGRLRDRIEVPASAAEEELRKAALASEKVRAAMGGKDPRKVIVVPGKLVNIVL
ncbi:MAG: leucine--tRNA ligase [Proteobacteria bacterium]|nr:leucine--tRNA ligase [Pseudomonadota bacterium]